MNKNIEVRSRSLAPSFCVLQIMSFTILLLLNVGRFYIHGPFHMMHYLSFTYMLNGSFLILHGLMNDMDPTNKFVSIG